MIDQNTTKLVTCNSLTNCNKLTNHNRLVNHNKSTYRKKLTEYNRLNYNARGPSQTYINKTFLYRYKVFLNSDLNHLLYFNPKPT